MIYPVLYVQNATVVVISTVSLYSGPRESTCTWRYCQKMTVRAQIRVAVYSTDCRHYNFVYKTRPEPALLTCCFLILFLFLFESPTCVFYITVHIEAETKTLLLLHIRTHLKKVHLRRNPAERQITLIPT
jgi:hypothetical protein